jgi:hypothetical protein
MEETRKAYRILVGKHLEKLHMEDRKEDGRVIPYLRVYKRSKIGVRLIHGIEKITYILRKRTVTIQTTEPTMPVLHVVKPPVVADTIDYRSISRSRKTVTSLTNYRKCA